MELCGVSVYFGYWGQSKALTQGEIPFGFHDKSKLGKTDFQWSILAIQQR
jgi:hypothetical protein